MENEKEVSGKVFSFLGEAAPEKNICNVARPRRTRGWPPADCSEEGVMHPLPPLSCNIAEAACSKTQCATFCGASVPYQSAYRTYPRSNSSARAAPSKLFSPILYKTHRFLNSFYAYFVTLWKITREKFHASKLSLIT